MTKRELSSATNAGLNFSTISLGLSAPHPEDIALTNLLEVTNPAKLNPSPFNPSIVEDSNFSNISGLEPDKHSEQPSFKNKNFEHSNKIGNKKKAWRTLKQILAVEQSLPWPQDAVTYSTIDAPPSFRPAKKYSDISGLAAPYTDPQTKLNYAVAEEFAEIRKLPSDIVQGYLTLRKANTQLQ